jgi:hypothetical protein
MCTYVLHHNLYICILIVLFEQEGALNLSVVLIYIHIYIYIMVYLF